MATKKSSGNGLVSNKRVLKMGATMLAITVLVSATGLVLGFRFNVFALGLLLLAAAASIFAIGTWNGGNAFLVALQVLATFGSAQIGYLIGCLIAAQFPAQAETPSNRKQTRYSRRLSARAAIR